MTHHVSLDTLILEHGSHKAVEEGLCVMEAVAWFAGEPHSDHPQCASPVVTQFAMGLNDQWPDDERQQLKSLIPLMVGTRDGHDQVRGLMAADWLIRIYTPAWLRLAGLTSEADAVAGLAPVTDWSMLAAAMKPLETAKRSAAAARDAAWDAARAAAWAAAGDAAWAAARDAAWVAARDAARDAAWAAARAAAWAAAGDAAWAAAGDAARAAARDAARDAAWAALAPTVTELHASALDLLRRMCLVGKETA